MGILIHADWSMKFYDSFGTDLIVSIKIEKNIYTHTYVLSPNNLSLENLSNRNKTTDTYRKMFIVALYEWQK